MKARLEHLSHRQKNQSFYCYPVIAPLFEFTWHYHPEYELTYIVKGSGKRLVGDSYANFSAGDLVLLGPNLPHTWVGEDAGGQNCEAVVIQFSGEFISPLLQYQEMAAIQKLLNRSERGLSFSSQKISGIVALLDKLPDQSGITAFTSLINILHQLTDKRTVTLSSVHFKPMKGTENQLRINEVFQYIQSTYHDKISLSKAASKVHLSESAFCKFIKRVSGKTFSELVNEIRIANACRLLTESDQQIAQIAFDSGFESLTYFNRVFLKKKKIRPKEFRAQYR